jgi:hypothetical protein
MSPKMMNPLILAVAIAAAVTPTTFAAAQSGVPSPTVKTRIGDLTYEAGFPTAETVQKLYDELDFQRAVLAHQYAETLVSYNEINVGLKGGVGGREGDMYVTQRLPDPHGIALTPNTTTIYAMAFLDLAKEGPVVVEVTPGSYGAFFDLWQLPIAGVGPIGEDKGKGGKFLVLPIDHKGAVPEGYFPVKSRTTLAAYFARGLVRDGDVAGAAKGLETTRIYPLSQRDNPPQTKVSLSAARTLIRSRPTAWNTGGASPTSSSALTPRTTMPPFSSRSSSHWASSRASPSRPMRASSESLRTRARSPGRWTKPSAWPRASRTWCTTPARTGSSCSCSTPACARTTGATWRRGSTTTSRRRWRRRR